jgi:SAM-dependent methyltransferase
MPDVYANVNALEEGFQKRLADALETRGADPKQREMRRAFLDDIQFPENARVLDVGSGTGVLTRILAGWNNVAEVVGVEPGESLVEKARVLADDLPNISFQIGDSRSLPFPDDSFDVIVFDSVLSHMPDPGAGLTEAVRVLAPGGTLAVFDGDYATMTVALASNDSLQTCIDTAVSNMVTDPYVCRKLPALLRAAGVTITKAVGHSYVDAEDGTYMFTLIDRGAEMLASIGSLDPATADALKAEARHRVERGGFFGHIAYVGFTASKRA